MNNKLFVGNLSYNTTENELQDAFAPFGTVLEANLMVDRVSGRPRGFGFVTFSTPEEAQKAVEATGTAVAIRGQDGVVFAVEKIITSKLYEKVNFMPNYGLKLRSTSK